MSILITQLQKKTDERSRDVELIDKETQGFFPYDMTKNEVKVRNRLYYKEKLFEKKLSSFNKSFFQKELN